MLDRTLTEFLEQGLAIHIGTRDARLRPNGCVVAAVRVEDEGRHLVAFIPRAVTPAVFDDLRSNGQAALSFTRPSDDKAVQVKGEFVSVADASDEDEQFARAQWGGFLKQLDLIGLPGKATMTWTLWPCVAVRIRVTALFSQTPGPEAGSVLR
jgi:hypothetical protein